MKLGHVLPRVLQTPVWQAIFDEYDQTGAAGLQARVALLKDRRNLDALAPSVATQLTAPSIVNEPDKIEIVKRLADHLGYHYRIPSNDPDAFLRFVGEASRLYGATGTNSFMHFLSYMLGIYLEYDMLWYDPLVKKWVVEQDSTIVGRRLGIDGFTDAQDVFPTSYLTLRVQQTAGFDTRAILDVFYDIAPANLIVRNIQTIYRAPLANLNVIPKPLQKNTITVPIVTQA